MLANESGLKPLGQAVLVQMYEPQPKKGALIELPENVKKSATMLEQRAIVIEVGPKAWADEGDARASAGDHVFVTKFAGFEAKGPKDGQAYRLVNGRDIFCRITHLDEEVANG